MTKTSKNEIAKSNSNELFLFPMDQKSLELMDSDAENYHDNTSAEDLAIPRIKIVQSGSDERKKQHPKFIKEAEEGDLLNTLTNQIYKGDQGLLFVPAHKRIVYLEWRDRTKGGGLVKNFGEDATEFLSASTDENGRRISANGNEIIKTYDFFGYTIDLQNKKVFEVVISMQKTQAKKAKGWNSIMRNLTSKDGKQLPIYAGLYKLTTNPEANDKGSWFNYKIEFVNYTLAIPEIGISTYNKAKLFTNSIKDLKVNYEEDESSSQSQSSDERM